MVCSFRETAISGELVTSRRLTTDNRALRSVLGDESSRNTAGGEDDDGTSVLLNRSSDSGEGKSLSGLGGSGSKGSELVEERLVSDSRLGDEGSFSHHLDYKVSKHYFGFI